MKALILVGALLLSAICGLAAGLFGWIGAVAVVVVSIPALIIADYRVGLMVLMVAMPFSQIHPRAFYAVFALLLLSAGSFFLKRMFLKDRLPPTPRVLWLGLVLPILAGFLLAWPHLGEARAALALTAIADAYTVKLFVLQNLLAPLTIVALAWMLGHAVRESRNPGIFIAAVGVAGVVIVAGIFGIVARQGASLTKLMLHREFLGVLGAHANEWGPMLAVATGPFLFLASDARGWRRVACVAVLLALLGGIALTFSRGGYLAFSVVLLTFLIQRGRIATIAAVVLAGAVLLAFAPSAVIERALMGLNADSLRQIAAGSSNDELSAGRGALYSMFAPEVLKSPLWGSGTASAAWSAAVRSGWTLMMHPHNLYLRILMDLGILGLLTLGWFYWRTAAAMRALSRSDAVPASMRSYLAGAFAGLLAMLAAGVSGEHWLPTNAHAFLWYSMGIVLAYWPCLAQGKEGQSRVALGDAHARALVAQRTRALHGQPNR